ncbi:MAG TPA: carboxypeptidase-like regulatory domain-containing protein, partial [Fibrobacteria bacterium]|nr:carboxypeptidase-like regulatory domain-containing protein [Fibrobacteria bacterium]
IMATILAGTFPLLAQAMSLSGTITDTSGVPVSGATVTLEHLALTTTSAANGTFTFSSGTPILPGTGAKAGAAFSVAPVIRAGALQLALNEAGAVTVTAHAPDGRITGTVSRNLPAGVSRLELPASGMGVRFYRIRAGGHEEVIRSIDVSNSASGSMVASASASPMLAKTSGGTELIDQIVATKTGYLKSYIAIRSSDSTGLQLVLLPSGYPKFSFFVVSQVAMQALSGKDSGFGGDFRYGETGSGAGLRGADKICAATAERSLKNAKYKGWRAFLSVKVGPYGSQVDAITRIGSGPWYDRVGRRVGKTTTDLLGKAGRPDSADAAIKTDLPNENGIPNQQPDPNLPAVDNHHSLTGSTTTGTLYMPSSVNSTTCDDWTTNAKVQNKRPRVGWTWTAQGRVQWISGEDEAGCGAGYYLVQTGSVNYSNLIVGSGGGYGAFYCFALNP